MDRYELFEQFEHEKIRRSLTNCDDLEAMRALALKLFECCQAQKKMLKAYILKLQ